MTKKTTKTKAKVETKEPKVPNLVNVFETNGKDAFREAVSQFASKVVIDSLNKK